MRHFPADRSYTEGHLWFLPAKSGESPAGEEIGRVGLTDHLQARLGDLIAAELPRLGQSFSAQETFASLEGLLESFELEAFCNFEVLEVNPRLEIHPDVINRQPYEDGWILKVRLNGVPRWLTAAGYADFLQNGATVEGA